MNILNTVDFKIELAKRVYDLMDLRLNSFLPLENRSFLYAVLGRQLPWPNDEIPVPTEAVNCLNQLFRTGLFVKRLTNTNASFVVKRIDWKTETVYDAFSDAICNFTYDLDFYAMNSQYQVFKCLDNNNNSPSTSEPSITLSTTSLEEPFIRTADGYKWKYLYTLSSIQRQKYLTEEWMPVSVNKFVSAAAINGSIDLVKIINSGNNYVSGSLQNIITVEGDGTNAALRANVVDGKIVDVIIQNRGQNYTYADLIVTDVPGGSGSGAELEISVAPQNGHGFDPVYELGATNLMFDCDFDGDDESFLADNDYRQVFIVKNPIDNLTGSIAQNEKYTCYYKIKTSPGVGNYNEDEKVFQGVTLEDATFTADVVYFDQIQNFLYLNNIRGNIAINDSIKGAQTGSIRIVNNVEDPTLRLLPERFYIYQMQKLFPEMTIKQTEFVLF